MICLSKNEQGAELLAGYLAKTLDASRRAELDRHFQECADCRGLVSVWERLDEFAAPEVTPGPLAAAAGVAALMLYLYPVRTHPLGTPDASKQASNSEIEQVAQAVDDLDLLTPIDR
jgi:hypothetical protein